MPDSSFVSELLEAAIERAARALLNRVRVKRRLSDSAFEQSLKDGIVSLDRLTTLRMPDYHDELVAALYLLRYHFAHVNLAWSSIASAKLMDRGDSSLVRPGTTLQVADFGAGTFATLFGVVLFAAELTEKGQACAAINIHSSEPAGAMRTAGAEVWQEFCRLIREAGLKERQESRSLIEALDRMEHTARADTNIPMSPTDHRWLFALHAVYPAPGQQQQIRNSLRRLHHAIQPTEGLMTCHSGNRVIAENVSPFGRPPHSIEPTPKIQRDRLAKLDDFCRDIGFIRYRENPQHRQVYATWSAHLSDTSVLYWPHDG